MLTQRVRTPPDRCAEGCKEGASIGTGVDMAGMVVDSKQRGKVHVQIKMRGIDSARLSRADHTSSCVDRPPEQERMHDVVEHVEGGETREVTVGSIGREGGWHGRVCLYICLCVGRLRRIACS